MARESGKICVVSKPGVGCRGVQSGWFFFVEYEKNRISLGFQWVARLFFFLCIKNQCHLHFREGDGYCIVGILLKMFFFSG